jgi:predicted TIM-barrel fold metal-dependent hydrolase
MDHAYKRHRYWMKGKELARLPSEYFRENISLTFQDDFTAFQFADMMGERQLMWASDFPHSDSTWPWSQDVIREQTAHLSDAQRRRILHDNVAELYKLAA